MIRLRFLIFLFGFSVFAQEAVKATLKDSIPLNVDTLYGADTYKTLYYSKTNNTFFKKTKDTIYNYANFQLNNITSANTFNPLKINLFYQDFNTVVILDNRLAEIFRVDFNTVQPYINVSFVSTGFSNTLWIFNQDEQRLELYDYINNVSLLRTVTISSNVLDLKSDYNYCYLLTDTYLYIYNYSGSLIAKHKNTGYERLAFSEAHLVLKKENELYLLQKNSSEIRPIALSNLLINQFLVTNESLYLYRAKNLYQYQLKLQ